MNRRAFIAALAASSAGSALAQTSPSAAAPLVYYAGQAGRLTSDRSSQGGNPFASALCEVIGQRPLTLETFTRRMAEANQIHSRGWQMLDYPRVLPEPKRRLDKGETRVALVLVNADYSKSDAYSLPGAAHDAKRVPAALNESGYQTMLVLDANAEEARAALTGAGLEMLETVGVSFSPLTGKWSLTRDTGVNYMVTATRPKV
jgi:hypothetical protein